MATVEADRQSFMVQAEDGRKFKMVIRGDLAKIPVEKIRRYLKAYGVPDGQTLSFEGLVLTDDMIGEHFGLQQNSVLFLTTPGAPIPSSRTRQETQTFFDGLASSRQPHATGAANRSDDGGVLSSAGHGSHGLAVDVEGRMRQHLYEEEVSRQHQQATSMSSAWPDRPSRAAPQFSPGPSRAVPSTAHQQPYGSGHTPVSTRQPAAAGGHDVSAETTLRMQQLESENSRLKREVEALKLDMEAKRISGAAPVEGLLANAKSNLLELGKELGVHLNFDSNLTCAIGNDERHTILVTFDAPTERLYLYSTILTFLPDDANTKLRLFEVLLDGALLGRDVAGGGIGVSLQSSLVMMSTSIPLRHCGPHALKDVVPVFVEALVRWRAIVSEVLDLKSV